MSGIEPLAIGALVGGTALSASGTLLKGQEESKAAKFEQQQLAVKEQQTKTAAMQDEANRRNALTSSLETIQAIRAGRGVGSTSPTAMGIYSNITGEAERDIYTSRVNADTSADLLRRGGILAGQKAKTSLLASYLGAGADVANAGFKAYNIGSFGRASPGRG